MKKLIAVLVSMLLLIGVSSALADDSKMFEPELTNAADLSASTWFSSDQYRALLTITLALDYSNIDESFDFATAMLGSTYVAYDSAEKRLLLNYLAEGKNYIILYDPALETAVYSEPVEGNEFALEMALDETDYTYYKNSSSTLLEVAEMISDVINEE